MVSSHSPKLFEPIQIGTVKVRNRIALSPMGVHYQSPNGEVTEKTKYHYAERAKGGTGLIIVGSIDILPVGYRAVPLLNLAEDRFTRGHYELTEAVHAQGAKVVAQIVHQGRQIPPAWLTQQPVSASAVPCVFLGETVFPTPRALEKGEIYQIMDRFAFTAERARRAGYDMVELHGAHGYLIASFLSPYLNRRTDEFGGSLENRVRFPLGILKRIKEVAGNDYPVGIRFSGDEFIEGGLTVKESPLIAKMLAEAGFAYINVSSGMYETLNKSNDIMRHKEGWKEYIWLAIKKAVNVPTIAGGGLRTPEYCENLLAEGKSDLVGLGRALLSDPEWPNKAAAGNVEDINRCISCLECLYGSGATFKRGYPRCTVNPNWGRDKELIEIKPATQKKRVMVIGGGPGGMETARIAAMRGHDVTLYDEGEALGGLLLLASKPPGKEKLLWTVEYLTTQIKKQKVRVELDTKVTPELVDKVNPDAVIVATGSEPNIPNIPGIKGKQVVTAPDVLAGKVKFQNQKVAVLGGGMIGCEIAEYLGEQGNKLVVIEMLTRVANDMEPHNRVELIERLKEMKVEMLTGHEVMEVTQKGVIALRKSDGSRLLIEADKVVIALGAQPNKALADALEGKVKELHVIGDCQQPRRALEAIYEGTLAGRKL